MTTAYRGSVLHSLGPHETELIPDGTLLVDGAGRIEGLAPGDELSRSTLRSTNVVDFEGRLILPGLVDAHLHIPQIDIVGIESEKLIDWLRNHIFSEETANEDEAIARDRARRTFREMRRNGTTACAAFSSSHTRATEIAFEEAERAGIRAVIGKVLMDRESPAPLLQEADAALDETARLIEHWSGRADGRLEVSVTPRFGISCSDELLEGAGRLAARTGKPIQTHLSENKTELETIAKLFPDARDYTDVYDRAGLLTPRSILAHCIHMSDGELGRLAEAGCSAVYCPDSNFFLHSGRFPLFRALDQDVNVAFGSDIGAGTSFSLFEAMKMGNYMQTIRTDPKLLLYLATVGGARALGWEDRIGNFLPGKAADFVVLDPSEILRGGSLHEADEQQLLSMLIHQGYRAEVEQVFVAGERVWPGGP